MKLTLTILIASVACIAAQAPRKEPLTKYRQLWENSLITDPPEVVGPGTEEPPSELDDYVLGGWTQSSQGYLVSLINTKDPKARVAIGPGIPNKKGFRILDVKRDPTNYMSSEVLVELAGKKKWIGYEEKFLVVQQPPAVAQQNKAQMAAAQRAAQQNQKQAQPPIPTSNNNNQRRGNTKQATPRVRRVPVPPKN
ncbi:hypothetical protein AAFN60_10515 [Roseibacillus persicicus]|uniref:hypothetical protein n=1 Tax=Roseibacillus persicicus TaxID=454148 RepID=UPI00398B696F